MKSTAGHRLNVLIYVLGTWRAHRQKEQKHKPLLIVRVFGIGDHTCVVI